MIEPAGSDPALAGQLPLAAGGSAAPVDPADAVRAILPGLPKAFLRVGGATLARHQLALALALGCERIICVARALDSDVMELQHAAEAAGAKFLAVTGPRGLMGLISTVDNVIAFAEGVLAAPDVAAALLSGPAVVVQPIENGLKAGFERIDANSASGGAMRIPGRLVERLVDLPPDCDAFSALQRIALQAGVAQREIPPSVIESGRWCLVRDEVEAHAAEGAWIRLHTHMDGGASATDLIARAAVRGLGPALLHAGTGGKAVVGAGAAAFLLALGAGWFGFAVTGFLLAGVAWLLRTAGEQLLRVERDSMQLPPSRISRLVPFDWLLDGALIALIAWGMPAAPDATIYEILFAPLAFLGLARLLSRAVPKAASRWLGDRLVIAAILAIASIAGHLSAAIAVLSIIMAAFSLIWLRDRTEVTVR